MKDLFKNMHLDKQPPEKLRKVVISELETLKLVGEFLDLFGPTFFKANFQLLGVQWKARKKEKIMRLRLGFGLYLVDWATVEQ